MITLPIENIRLTESKFEIINLHISVHSPNQNGGLYLVHEDESICFFHNSRKKSDGGKIVFADERSDLQGRRKEIGLAHVQFIPVSKLDCCLTTRRITEVTNKLPRMLVSALASKVEDNKMTKHSQILVNGSREMLQRYGMSKCKSIHC
ncbi:hypothetical protein Ocin01_02735 [Orchesella cincta]|uniref:Uncharacterized protein n=1 Tax=Orchesella cincta TaxID=48709 RepID=A0A1D2NFD4_ORCCI|nr:hypothetical protein Ocin01_02735 [Orchesella cincta]